MPAAIGGSFRAGPNEMRALVLFKGQCHCGAIRVELASDRPPHEQVLGACQCSFCRKHNARAFSDPKAHVTLTAADPQQLQRYSFGLQTSDQIICRRCGVYIAMTLTDGEGVWSVINVDALEAHFSVARLSCATIVGRIARAASQEERPAGARPRSSAGLRLTRGSLLFWT
jgi:hypothetical protein